MQLELGVQSEYVFTYQGKRIKGGIGKSLKTVLKKAGLRGVTRILRVKYLPRGAR